LEVFMPIVKPISDLRNHADQISKICHERAQPVLITKNGKGDMIVMSVALFRRQEAQMRLYQKLTEAEEEAERHPAALDHKEMMQRLRKRLA